MLKNKIILRYLIKENFLSFLIIFVFSCLLFISIDLIELIRRGSSKNIEFGILLKMSILHIPSLFPIILPTVFLLSSMNTYMKLNKNNELSVLRASGFSIWSLIFPALINVMLISAVFILLFNPIFAFMNIKFKNYESIYFKGSSGLYSISQTGLWLRERNKTFEYVINAKHYSSQEKELKEVKIFKFDLSNKFLERIDTENVKMINDKLWLLNNGYRLELNKPPQKFDQMELEINLDANKIEKNFRPPETISFWELKKYIKNLVDLTKDNEGMSLTLALNYGGRAEIVRATRRIGSLISQGKISETEIDENLFSSNLDACNVPDPDLIIRTAGERRLSNFLLWQSAYSELYFSDKSWPDFSNSDLKLALADYHQRTRKFGGLHEAKSAESSI